MKLKGFISIIRLFSILFLALITIPCGYRGGDNKDKLSYSDQDFTPADRFLCQNLFALSPEPNKNGDIELKLTASHFTYVPYKDTNPERYRFYYRQAELVDADSELKKDPNYRAILDRLSKQAARQLANVNERVGRQIIYPWLLKEGVFHRIIAKAGPSDVVHIPADITFSPWGDTRLPFVSGGNPPTDDVPAAVIPFHYCSGLGIVITGGDRDPNVRAHKQLLAEDPMIVDGKTYSTVYREVITPFIEEGKRIDPSDYEKGWDLTKRLWKALVKKGIAKKIEEYVAREKD